MKNFRVLPLLSAALLASVAGAQSVNPDVEPGAPKAKPAPGRAFVSEVLDFVDPAFPSDFLRQTIQDAVDAFRESLRSSDVPRDVQLTLLPVVGDRSGYVFSLMKGAVTEAGRTFVVAENDPAWNAIVSQREWTERKGDLLDKDTLLHVTRALQAARLLLVSEIRVAQISDRGVLVEIDAHVVDGVTARHLWGGVFSRRRYAGAEPPKMDDIPAAARKLIREGLRAKTAESLKASAALAGVKTVAVIPLFADVEGYATGVLKEALGDAGLVAVNLDVSSESEARALLRDKPAAGADAFLSGVVRRLPETEGSTNSAGVATKWMVEWSATVEKPDTREQPWTATVEESETTLEPFGWWDRIVHHLPFLRGRGWTLVCAAAALAAVWALLRATTRVR